MGRPCPAVTSHVEVEGELPWHATVVLAYAFPPIKTESSVWVNVYNFIPLRGMTPLASDAAFTHDAFLLE
jgi:hypothetical protein